MKKININYILIILSTILLIIGWVVPFGNEIIPIVFFIASYLCVGAKVLFRVCQNFIHKNFFDENTLMGIASLGAICIGDYKEAVFVMLLYSIGMILQGKAVNKSRRSIAQLMDIQAEYANVIKGDSEERVDIYDVKVGDLLLIKAGEKVPVDAVVVEGESCFDASSITGESKLKYLTVGDELISGTINKDGVVKAKATAVYFESTVSKILELVEEATAKKSKTEHFITRFAKWYTPVVCIISLLIFLIPVLFGLDTLEWLKKALIFLVVSCPCALVISIPLSFFGGIGGLSRKGVLVKGSNYLEALSKTKIVAFDKTGTLTNGEFEIVSIHPLKIGEKDFLSYLYAVEKYSNHILGKAIKTYCENAEIIKNLHNLKAENIKEIAGYGITANIDGEAILVGSEKLLADNNVEFQKAESCGTIVYVSKNGICLGFAVLKDKLKTNSKQTIQNLKANGYKTVLLSGDNNEIVQEIGSQLEFDEVYGELKPNDKVEKVNSFINAIKDTKGKVVFVGDGVNDAPVLTRSDIGVSMGGFGTDSAKEASDIVIMNDEISQIGVSIKSSKKTMRIIKENITFALLTKFAILILDICGFATMGLAVFADVGVTILAILNSLRCLK